MKPVRNIPFLTVVCVLVVVLAGCASKWDMLAETPEPSVHWSDDRGRMRVRHLMTVTGFKESGVSLSTSLKYIVFGRRDMQPILRPIAVTTGKDGRLAVADTGCRCVHLYIPAEQRYVQLNAADEAPFLSPVSVVFDSELRLYVSDSAGGAIHVFDRVGAHLSSLRKMGTGTLQRPTGLTYDHGHDVVYAVDTLAHSIYALTPSGELVRSFGDRGVQHGEFNYPTHIALSPAGDIYVTDTMNFRVQVFDTSGTFVTVFGRHGNGSGDFAMPKGIAVDRAGTIYVIDTLFDAVQLFDLNGDFLLTIGSRGTGTGEFWLPSGAFLDDQERLYVCDTYNQRIQVFEIIGNYEKKE